MRKLIARLPERFRNFFFCVHFLGILLGGIVFHATLTLFMIVRRPRLVRNVRGFRRMLTAGAEADSEQSELLEVPFIAFAVEPNVGTYFSGTSAVQVDTVGEILDFLDGCKKRPLHWTGIWGHPLDFERRRTGVCRDRALWAWRKLVELGYRADLCVGLLEGKGHVWVRLRGDSNDMILESMAPRNAMLRPAGDDTSDYRLQRFVDSDLRRFMVSNFASNGAVNDTFERVAEVYEDSSL